MQKMRLIELFDKSYKDFVTDDTSGLPAMIKGLSNYLRKFVVILNQ